MTEQFSIKGKMPNIAFVTMVPSVVEALTGEPPTDLNLRFVSKICLTDDDNFKAGLEATVGGRDATSKLVIDLFFLPTITGQWDTKNSNNIGDLSSRLDGYDLVVDLCEMTALYRPGKMNQEAIDAAADEFPDVDPDVTKSFLKHRNFLKVVNALATMMKGLRGRAIRPSILDAVIYEWGRTPKQNVSIRDMSLIKNWSAGTVDEGWASLGEDDAELRRDPIFNAVSDEDRAKLDEAWAYLQSNGMDTLKRRVMLSEYSSDLSSRIDRMVNGKNGANFTCTLKSILDHRRDEKERYAEFSQAQKDKITKCRNKLELTYESLENSGKEIHLIDYLQLHEQLDEGVLKDGSRDDARLEEFKSEFADAFAFLNFWNTVESKLFEHQLNEKINGWYMANSSYWVLRQAFDSHGLKSPITAWAFATLLTNSIGFLPSREGNISDIREAVFREVLQIVPVGIDA